MPNLNRVILIAMLLSILVSCRVLCARAECLVAHGHLGADEHGQEVPHPANDDACICNGGLQSDDAKPILAGLDPSRIDLGIDLPPPGLLPGSSPRMRSVILRSGWRPDPPSRGLASESCAWLQRHQR